MAIGAQLVGSVNLPDTEAVLRLIAGELGTHVRRIPDGETGDRLGWIGCQLPVIMAAGFTPVAPVSYGGYELPQLVPPEGEVVFGSLGYAAAAIESWATFQRLQAEGVIPAGIRFQVSLPTPQATVSAWVNEADRGRVLEPYAARLLAELEEIVAAIPNDQLAVQWDVAVEVGILDGPFRDPSDFEVIANRLAALGEVVPAAVELGYHFCYGDYGHEHFRQPDSLALCVALADRLTAQVRRQITWFHMPVPRHIEDEAYFAPLAGYRPRPGTELYLGIVYDRAGVDVSRRLAALAQSALRIGHTFGVATECGMGRVPTEDVVETVQRHAVLAAPNVLEAVAV